jgi:transcriptional regulator with XRE-family HTH domain
MVAKGLDEVGLAELAPLILKPLRKMRGVRSPEMAERMGISARAYQDFENGRTSLLLVRVREFADILKLDHFAILAAFHLGKPRIAHAFANNKFMLIQASAVDEFDESVQDAIAAVDPLTVLDAHMQLYEQLAELGRAQLRAARGDRPPPTPRSP